MNINEGCTTPAINHCGIMDTDSPTAAEMPQTGKENTHRKTRRRKANKVRRVVNDIVYENGIYVDSDFGNMDLSIVASKAENEGVKMVTASDVADRNTSDTCRKPGGVANPVDACQMSLTGDNHDNTHCLLTRLKSEPLNHNAMSVENNVVPVCVNPDNMETNRPNRSESVQENENNIKGNKFKQILDTNGNLYSRKSEMDMDFQNVNGEYGIEDKIGDFKYNYVMDLTDKALDLSIKKNTHADYTYLYNGNLPVPSSIDRSSTSVPAQALHVHADTPSNQLSRNGHNNTSNHSIENDGNHIPVKAHSKSKLNGQVNDRFSNSYMVNEEPVNLEGNNTQVKTITCDNDMSSYRKLVHSSAKSLVCDSQVPEHLRDIKQFHFNKNGFSQNLALINNIPPTMGHMPEMSFENLDGTSDRTNTNSGKVKHDPAMAFISPRVHTCKICLSTFHLRKDLIAHIRTHPFKKHECNVCHRFFNELGNLRQHKRVHDEGDMPHECLTCQRKFRHKSTLNNHLKTHTNERPYMCPICGKGFKIANGLTTHMRKHTGECPYSCEHCDKTFRNYSNLQQHQFQHNGIRRFQCGVCLAKFSRKSILDNHVEKLHGHTDGVQHTSMLADESDIDSDVKKIHGQADGVQHISTLSMGSDVDNDMEKLHDGAIDIQHTPTLDKDSDADADTEILHNVATGGQHTPMVAEESHIDHVNTQNL